MRFKTITLLLLSLSFNQVQAQEKTIPKSTGHSNIAYLEVGGVAAYYSANFQHNFYFSRRAGIGAGIVVSPTYAFFSNTGTKFSPRAGFQLQGIYRVNARSEFGVGAAINWYTWYYPQPAYGEGHYQKVSTFTSAQFGYNYLSKQGMYLGAFFTPIITDHGTADFTPWGGLRIGYRFK